MIFEYLKLFVNSILRKDLCEYSNKIKKHFFVYRKKPLTRINKKNFKLLVSHQLPRNIKKSIYKNNFTET